MTIVQSILLGIVQGLTEFLPISSSGHLVIVPYLFGWDFPPEEAFIFDVLVQVATLAAVFTYFWSDVVSILRAILHGLLNKQPFDDPQARLGWLLALASLPAGLIGLALKDAVERAFGSPTFSGAFLLVTAGLLLIAEKVGERSRALDTLTWKDALWIGFAQALAIFPGISRSGATITGGMARDLQRPEAARFSFLMSIPIMLAAGLFAILKLITEYPDYPSLLPTFLPGFLASAVTGYLSIRWLLAFLVHRPLYIFSIYCAAIGILVLILSLF
ncbi:MAG: undecaprenyl-diphosphatase UppP [Anaerolineales bacterium]|nr:undecaprenyl-diphosphatase UppP [Anaerolineales bacterium]